MFVRVYDVFYIKIQFNNLKLCNLNKIFMVLLFYGWGSTASSLELLGRGSLLFISKFPQIPGTHFINLGRMKG